MEPSRLTQGVLMADGNLRLETQRSAMLVHRSILSLHSLFFRHLFISHTSHHEPSTFHCTHSVTIHDEDLVHYIEFLYTTREYVAAMQLSSLLT